MKISPPRPCGEGRAYFLGVATTPKAAPLIRR